ncbi:MAG: hypothetical protein M3511_08680 [Deinococcota bacterium]|nr:hypothetical protein [Deinococcota bacterium]
MVKLRALLYQVCQAAVWAKLATGICRYQQIPGHNNVNVKMEGVRHGADAGVFVTFITIALEYEARQRGGLHQLQRGLAAA